MCMYIDTYEENRKQSNLNEMNLLWWEINIKPFQF